MTHNNEQLDALRAERVPTVVNVFSDGDIGGNPCPVVLDATGMSPEDMYAVAQAYGYESVFVFPVSVENDEADLNFRYFVPEQEMEMCGHATLGAIWLLRQAKAIDRGIIRIRTAAGIVLADARDEQIRLSQPATTVRVLKPDEKQQVLKVLNLEEGALASPVLCNASTSRPKTLIALASADLLNRLCPRFSEIKSLCEAVGSTGLYPFVRIDPAAPIFEARQFPKASGYPEDAATGIAAAALFGALTRYHADICSDATVTVLQGRAMGHPSRMQISRAKPNTESHVASWLSGAVTVPAAKRLKQR